MRKLILFGIILTIFFSSGCNSLEDIDNNVSESNNFDPPVMEREENKLINQGEVVEKRIDEKVPNQLIGGTEDEIIRVSILAEIESDKTKYITKIIFNNKTEKSLELVYDCGIEELTVESNSKRMILIFGSYFKWSPKQQ